MQRAQAKGAQVLIGDLGRYWSTPEYRAQLWKMREALDQAVGWYEEGKVRPHVSTVVPFKAKALQRALDDLNSGKSSAGKTVVRIAH